MIIRVHRTTTTPFFGLCVGGKDGSALSSQRSQFQVLLIVSASDYQIMYISVYDIVDT